MKPFIKQAFVVSGAALNIAGHGCAHGFPAVLFAQLQVSGEVVLTDHDTSWIASVVGAMGIVGNFISPVLMNRFGRQRAHLITTVPALLGWVIFFLGSSVPLFLLARLLHGLALGLRTPLAAILVAEYTDPKYRGAFLGTFAISLGLGIFLSHLWGAHLTWRMTAGVCALFPLISMAIISLSPESASWLVSKAKYEEAKKAFRWVRGVGETQDEELEAMITAHKEEQRAEMQRKDNTIKKFTCNGMFRAAIDSIKDALRIFKRKEFYKPAVIAISMLVVFEFGGAHMFAAYGNIILMAVLDRAEPKDVAWQFTLVDLLRTICAFVAIFLLKYFKRRTILFTSGVLTVISLSAISVFIYMRKAGLFTAPWILDIVPTGLMVFYTLVFCLGLVPLNWVICGEVFPLAYRSLGSTLSTLFLTPSFVISMKTAPHLYSSVGVEGAFLVYSATLVVFLSIMYALLPETKDRTLQDIEDSFKGRTRTDQDVQMTLINKEDIVVMK